MTKKIANINLIILFIIATKIFGSKAKRKTITYNSFDSIKSCPCSRFLIYRKETVLVVWTLLLILSLSTGILAHPLINQDKPFISEQPVKDYFPLVSDRVIADVYVDPSEWKVVKIAARDLTEDIQRVTGRKPALKETTVKLSAQSILIGTIGRSSLIDRLIKKGQLDVSSIRGKWESFLIKGIADPLPGVKQGLVIVGSDRRGTAYGVYELSRRIGVSPWYWWADVTPQHHEVIYVSPDQVIMGPPAVKYRGIFINDEMWGIRPWAAGTFAPDEGLGLGPKTYAKIFELLLRLRANYLWPAMHLHTRPFNSYPQNKVVADDYAIVMGSSHIEPMLRNNMHGAEWDEEVGTEWNYQTNREAILNYWARRLKTNGRYENIYTLGMRGKDDEPMQGGNTVAEKIALLEQIFADQRQLLTRYVNPDLTKVPQLFIPYTEVLEIYEKGLKVPDDVIICWPDDNFGYIRRLPTPSEQERVGGSGIYYHIQWLNGATTAYTWLNTTPPALMWEELNKAFQYGAKSLWVLNVGDIKPGEIGIEFFMEIAWDPYRYGPDNVRDFLVSWAARDLDPRFAEEIAQIMEEHFQLGFTRRPEHLVQFKQGKLEYSWFSHTHYNDEATRRLERYAKIASRAQAIYDQLPKERKDAFFELVLYPVQCAYQMNRKILFADKNIRYALQGRSSTREKAEQARLAASKIIELTNHYNQGLITVGGKWNHMMSWAPGPWGNQFYQFVMPPLSDYDGNGPPALGIELEGGDEEILADLSVYTQGRRFIDLFNKGKGCITWQAIVYYPWVKLSNVSGTFSTEQRIWVSIDWNHAPTGKDIEATVDIKSSAGSKRIRIPIFNPSKPRPNKIKGFVESHGYVSMEAEHYTRIQERGGASWQVIRGLGRSGDSVSVFPPTVDSRVEPEEILKFSPFMEYDMYVFHSGEARLDIDCLPTLPVGPGRGVRLAVSLDQSKPQVLEGKIRDVLANLRRLTTKVKISQPGKHTLTIWMVDPGVVIDKIVLYFNPPVSSYLGPPESYHR
ncbi:MAG: glycosyl hydrolase 115 family protein [Candidatus Aminicenantes bacterium]|nr:glycosyl hydrolase 115 family protein [Candidatus Aminicenantes bacterium]